MQARKVLMLETAKEDLRAIRKDIYSVSASKTVADNYLKKIRRGLRHLEYTAEACMRYYSDNGRDDGYRFCPVEDYVAFFRIDDANVYVDRILLSRRDYERVLK